MPGGAQASSPLPPSPADSGVSDVDSHYSSNDEHHNQTSLKQQAATNQNDKLNSRMNQIRPANYAGRVVSSQQQQANRLQQVGANLKPSYSGLADTSQAPESNGAQGCGSGGDQAGVHQEGDKGDQQASSSSDERVKHPSPISPISSSPESSLSSSSRHLFTSCAPSCKY